MKGGIEAPRLITDNAYGALGNTLLKYSQDGLDYNQRQRAFEQQALDNQWNRNFQQTKYNNELQNNANKLDANVTAMKTLFPEETQKISSQFTSLDGNNTKVNNILGNMDIGSFAKNKDFIYKANKDQKDFEYQQNRDKISDGFERDRINIQRMNAGKPSETERLLSIIMGGGVPKETNPQVENLPQGQNQQSVQNVLENKPQVQTNNGSLANVTQGIKTENKPISQVDIVTAKNDVKFRDIDGRLWGRNPITKREYLIEDVKPKEIKSSEVEDINKSIEVYNNLKYAKDNYEPDYTGMIDDKVNYIANAVGYDSKNMQDYNKWATSLQSVGNAARNKSFGAALSGFDIGEFAKEYPSTDAGDGTIIPKLEVRTNMLKNSLQNTYNLWVENYGKERADKYFSSLMDKSIIGKTDINTNQGNNYSDEEILKALKGGK